MNTKIANAFILAAVNVLKTMAFVDPIAGKPFFKKDNKSIADISGTLGITGINVKTKGSMTVAFTKSAILKIMANMLGETHTDINAEVRDAVGEITNMISGQARKKLSEDGSSFEASLPTVIVGAGQEIYHVKEESVIIPFRIDDDKFFIDIAFTD